MRATSQDRSWDLSRGSPPRVVGVIVSDRITEGEEAPAHEKRGWLDLRGDLHLEAPGSSSMR